METNDGDLVNNISVSLAGREEKHRGRSFAGQLPVTSAIRTQLPFYPIALISFLAPFSSLATSSHDFFGHHGNGKRIPIVPPYRVVYAFCHAALRYVVTTFFFSLFLSFSRSTSFVNVEGKIITEKSIEITTHRFLPPHYSLTRETN